MPTKYWSVALTCTQVSQLHYTSIATTACLHNSILSASGLHCTLQLTKAMNTQWNLLLKREQMSTFQTIKGYVYQSIMHDQGKLVLLHGICDLSLSFIFTIHVGNLNLQFCCFKRNLEALKVRRCDSTHTLGCTSYSPFEIVLGVNMHIRPHSVA